MEHNRYFDGQVQSLGFVRNGLRATIGVMEAGGYRFSTVAAERMTVISGRLSVRLSESESWISCLAGSAFEISADSSFDVRAEGGPAAYLCEYLPHG